MSAVAAAAGSNVVASRAALLRALDSGAAHVTLAPQTLYSGTRTQLRRALMRIRMPTREPHAQNSSQASLEADDDNEDTLLLLPATEEAERSDLRARSPAELDAAASSHRVLVKSLTGSDATAEDASRLCYEFRAFMRVSEEAAAACWAPLALRRTQQGGLVLLLPDSGGELLSDWLRSPRPLAQIVRAALAVCEQLSTLHAAHVILNLLMPSAILYNPATHAVQFLDFGRSSLLTEEDASLSDGVLRAMSLDLLKFASPESTGRANRTVDSRSDLYAFGCVLFAMLQQGACPFDAPDALAIVHQHLAQAPPPLRLHSGASQLAVAARSNGATRANTRAAIKDVSPSAAARSHDAACDSCEADLRPSSLPWDLSAAPAMLALERVVGHLLAKSPEDRYLSARGVMADLSWISSTLEKHMRRGTAGGGAAAPAPAPAPASWSSFQLGAFDAASTFRLSGRLYGRENEVKHVMDAFDRISGVTPPAAGPNSPIRSELVLIGGYSGVGKTSVVESCQTLLVRSRAMYARAKFDMFRRSAGVLVSMLDGVLQTILVESAPERARWASELRAALGGNGAIFITLLPLLEQVIGPQDALPALSASERESIFASTFLRFLAVFARPAHPLVIFVDDLQWGDPLSMRLIQKLLQDGVGLPDTRGAHSASTTTTVSPALPHLSLLIIGAYRSNEIFPAHPLTTMLEELRLWESAEAQRASMLGQVTGARLHELHLQPLPESSVQEFVRDSFLCGQESAAPLAKLLMHRCSGNPWFTRQVLQRWHADGLIYFDAKGGSDSTDASSSSSTSCGRWTWSLPSLSSAHVGANVVDLLIANFRQLPRAQAMVLHQASILGNHFSMEQLTFLDQHVLSTLAADVWQLVQLGLIRPVGQAFELYLAAVAPGGAARTPPPQQAKTSEEDAATALPSAAVSVPAGPVDSNLGSLTWRAAEARGIDPRSLSFVFAHDSCQQSAYSLGSSSSRGALHARVARALLERLPSAATAADAAAVFDAAEHVFAAGLVQVTGEEELVQWAELLLRAGRQAKADTMWQLAERYLSRALDALHAVRESTQQTDEQLAAMQRAQQAAAAAEASPNATPHFGDSDDGAACDDAGLELELGAEASSIDATAAAAYAAQLAGSPRHGASARSDATEVASTATAASAVSPVVVEPTAAEQACWARFYPLSLAVHAQLCEVSYHTAQRSRAESLMGVCLAQTQPPRPVMDRVSVLELRLAALCVHASAVKDAIATGMQILELCGQEILEFMPRSEEIERTVMSLSGAGEDLPECRDEKQLCVARTLSQLSPCAYLSQAEHPLLMADISATMLFHMLKHGTSGAIGVGLSIVSIFLWYQSTVLSQSDMPAAERRMQAALRMSDITCAVDQRYVRHPDPRMSSRAVWGRAINACWGSTYHYKYPVIQSVPKLMEAVASLSLYGDGSFLGHCIFFAQQHGTHSAWTVAHSLARNDSALRLLQAHDVVMTATYFQIQREALLYQQGKAVDVDDKGAAQWPPPCVVADDEGERAVGAGVEDDVEKVRELIRDASENGLHTLQPVQRLLLCRLVALQKFSATMYIATGMADMGQCLFFSRRFASSSLFFARTKPLLPSSPGAWVWATWHLYANLARMQVLADVAHVDQATTAMEGMLPVATPDVHTRRLAVPPALKDTEKDSSAASVSAPSAAPAGAPTFDEVMSETDASVTLMTLFARFCPENWQHRVDLLRAEQLQCFMCRTGGDSGAKEEPAAPATAVAPAGADAAAAPAAWSPRLPAGVTSSVRIRHAEYLLPALALYDAAIAGARQHGFVQDAALANELAGEFMLVLGRSRDALVYLRASMLCWTERGCMLKVQQLQERFPALRRVVPMPAAVSQGRIGSHSPRAGAAQDRSSDAGTDSDAGGGSKEAPMLLALPIDRNSSRDGVSTSSSSSSSGTVSADRAGFLSTTVSTGSPESRSAASNMLSESSLPVGMYPSPPVAPSPPPLHSLEVAAVMKAAQAYSCETDIDVLLERLMRIVLQMSSASRAVLLLEQDGEWRAELQASVEHMYAQGEDTTRASIAPIVLDSDEKKSSGAGADDASAKENGSKDGGASERVHIRKADAFPSSASGTLMPTSIFQYLLNSRQVLVLSFDERGRPEHSSAAAMRTQSTAATLAAATGRRSTGGGSPADSSSASWSGDSVFARDPYFRQRGHCPRSVLALPVLKGGVLLAMLYLENDYSDVSVSFSAQHIQILQLLCSQAALSLENARFTHRLQVRNDQLQMEVAQRQVAVAEMRIAKEEAEHAAKARIDFVNVMSHEIRTPLNCVLVMSRLLADTPGLSQEQRHFTQLITHSGRLLTGIIGDGQSNAHTHMFAEEVISECRRCVLTCVHARLPLHPVCSVLDYSRALSGKLEMEQSPFALLDCLEPALHLCALMAAQKGLDLAYTCDPSLPAVVWGDSTHLQQLIMNLVGNACKYTQEGFIELHITRAEPEQHAAGTVAQITSPPSSTAGTATAAVGLKPLLLHFRLKDTGIGIPAAVQPRLFLPFEQADASTRRRFGGTGLGLTISKQLVEAMHGSIEMESQVGVGSEFRWTAQVLVADPHATATHHLSLPAAGGLRGASDERGQALSPLGARVTSENLGAPPGATQLLTRRYEHLYECVAGERAPAHAPAVVLLVCAKPAKARMLRTLLGLAGTVRHVSDWTEAAAVWQANKQAQASGASEPPIDVVVWAQPSVHKRTPLNTPEANPDATSTPSSPAPPMPPHQLLASLRGSSGAAQAPAASSLLLLMLTSDPRLSADPRLEQERAFWPSLRVVTLLEPFQQTALLRILHHRAELVADDVVERSAAQAVPSTLADRAFSMMQADEAEAAGDTSAREGTSPQVESPTQHTARIGDSGVAAKSGAESSSPALASRSSDRGSAAASSTAAASTGVTRAAGGGGNRSAVSSNRAGGSSHIPLLYPSMKLNVLIVEDNKINVRILLKLLERLGWPTGAAATGAASAGSSSPCLVAYDGLQCLSLLTSLLAREDAAAHLPHVILMDCAMQGLDGLDTTARIRAEFDSAYARVHRSPPLVIACTATTSAENQRQCAEVGMNGFLAKPLSVEALVQHLRAAHAALQQHTSAHQPTALQEDMQPHVPY